jgi:lipopolysaccharide export system protein LptA
MARSRSKKIANKHFVLLGALCLFLHWALAQQPDPYASFPKPHVLNFKNPIFAPYDKNKQQDITAPQQPLTPPVAPKVGKHSKSVIFLENAEQWIHDDNLSPDVQVISQNVRFRQDNTYMFCDSAYFYQAENSIDAFGNVKMVQGDTLYLYGDVLYYDGNTKLARLKYNVRMVNRKVTLTTDSLLFDRNLNVGYYTTGGKIVDETNTLTSLIGEYHPSQRLAIFKTAVKLVNPDFVLRSDTLRYNTGTGVADIVGPSNILYKEKTTINSKRGWYATRENQSQLFDRSVVLNRDGRQLTGDTIFYDKKNGIGISRHNVVIADTTQKIDLFGDYSYYDENKHYGYVTQKARLVQYDKADTLYMHADTLMTRKDSVYNTALGYHNVRIFRNDFQGVCDSIFYSERDSVMRMYGRPVIWSDDQQLNGEEIQSFTKNKEIDHIHVLRSAFATARVDSIRFNQLSGKDLTAYLRKQQVYRIDVNGNAESIFFPRDKDSTLIGMNSTQSSFLTMYIKEKKVDKVVLTPASNGVMSPIETTKRDDMFLKNYTWQESARPKDKDDIFSVTARPQTTTVHREKHRRQPTPAQNPAPAK